jgi:hypothetical protein
MMSNSRELDVDDIHVLLVEMASTHPSITIEMVDLSETIAMLKRERSQARRDMHRKVEAEIALIRDREAGEIRQVDAYYDVHRKAEAEIALIRDREAGEIPQVNAYYDVHRKAEAEIALIRDREAGEIRQVDAHYDVQLHDARARLKSRLSLVSGSHAESTDRPLDRSEIVDSVVKISDPTQKVA